MYIHKDSYVLSETIGVIKISDIFVGERILCEANKQNEFSTIL